MNGQWLWVLVLAAAAGCGDDGARPASSPNLVRYDNFVLSTQPVGCLDR